MQFVVSSYNPITYKEFITDRKKLSIENVFVFVEMIRNE